MTENFFEVDVARLMPFHGLTPSEAERLHMLAEEANEIGVAVAKILRHGPYSYNPEAPDDGTNIEQLNRELADLAGVILGMGEAGDPFCLPVPERQRAAWERKLRYAHHQNGPGA